MKTKSQKLLTSLLALGLTSSAGLYAQSLNPNQTGPGAGVYNWNQWELSNDLDGDGRLDVLLDQDFDLDGNVDVLEDVNGNGILDAGEDIDGDRRLDVLADIDQDGDGNFDVVEADPFNGLIFGYEDTDRDGNLDVAEDTDRDGNLDFGEDTDGDGIIDPFEDVNGDGVLSDNEDLDGDGNFDTIDEDTDGDGILDAGEDLDGDGRLDRGLEDLDGDGRFDNVNEDIDGDRSLDLFNEDQNGNGVIDTVAPNRNIQASLDANGNFRDLEFLVENGLFVNGEMVATENYVDAADARLQGQIDQNRSAIRKNKEDIETNTRGIAMVAALQHTTVLPGMTNAFDLSAAHFEGETGMALNYARRINDNVQINFGAASTTDFEESVIKAGIGVQW